MRLDRLVPREVSEEELKTGLSMMLAAFPEDDTPTFSAIRSAVTPADMHPDGVLPFMLPDRALPSIIQKYSGWCCGYTVMYPSELSQAAIASMHELMYSCPSTLAYGHAVQGLSVTHLCITRMRSEVGKKHEMTVFALGRKSAGSLFQVFSTLKLYGIRQYFDEITLSSIVGYRKPHPNIFRIACEQANLPPEECAFVGDTLSRDVVGPRKAGYGRIFKINSFLTPQKDIGKYEVAPDYEITDIYDVYTLLKKELEA